MFTAEMMTRAHALGCLEDFLPKSGAAYAKGRNFDAGVGQHHAVSCLSAYFRRRLITEEEAIGAVLKAQSFSASEKFIQEIFWRTYFKGWLEMRPSIWQDFLGQRQADPRHVGYRKAIEGKTGIDCFDAWSAELQETGYLHNHARMWFASIWIFTLRLPWAWGADFFLTHLADGDPASNTLSWRWVAGLHSRGKHYLARADNIDSFTRGRFQPYGQLNEKAGPLEELPPPSPMMITPCAAPERKPAMLLITAEDCTPETHDFGLPIVGVASLPAELGQVMQSEEVLDLDRAAMKDSCARAGLHFDVPIFEAESLPTDPTDIDSQLAQVMAEAEALGAAQLVMLMPPVGFWHAGLGRIKSAAAAKGLDLALQRRPYDSLTWPHAKKGFFPFKEKIPSFISAF